jgi:competence protein ComEA
MDLTPQPELLTRRHQLTVAVIVGISMSVLAVSTAIDRQRHGRPINIDRPHEVRQASLTIDLNSAAWPELTLLPEISETMARRIVEHRELTGEFATLEDVQQVKGIGPRTFARIQPYLRPIIASQAEATEVADGH